MYKSYSTTGGGRVHTETDEIPVLGLIKIMGIPLKTNWVVPNLHTITVPFVS